MPYSDEQGIEKSSLVERARSLSPIQKTGQRELDKGEFRDVPDRFSLDALVSIAARAGLNVKMEVEAGGKPAA